MRYAVGMTPVLENLGSELLVCDVEGQTVHRLTGEGRRRFEQVLEAGLAELPADEVTAALEAAGLLVPVGETDAVEGVSRRRALAIGATAAAAGVVALALPSAAAAQSGGGESYPAAPSSGTAPTPPISNGLNDLRGDGFYFTALNWVNLPSNTGVTYNYRLYSPANVLLESGTASGQTSYFEIPIGQYFIWYAVAVGGTSITRSGTAF